MENDKIQLCEDFETHKNLIKYIFDNIPDNETLYGLAELYRIFGDTTRIKILYVLFESEVCVCDIAEILNMTVSAISHQLRILKTARLVKFRKDGKTCFYSLKDDHVKDIIAKGIEHIKEGL